MNDDVPDINYKAVGYWCLAIAIACGLVFGLGYRSPRVRAIENATGISSLDETNTPSGEIKVTPYVPEPDGDSLWEDSLPVWEKDWKDEYTTDTMRRSYCRQVPKWPTENFEYYYNQGSLGTKKEMLKFFKNVCTEEYK